MKRNNLILKEVLEKVKPTKEEFKTINKFVTKFLKEFKKSLKKEKIEAEIFIGGSFAKETLIKKGKYDVDIFVRFFEKYKDEEISDLAEKILKNFKNVKKIHGSRDYFRVAVSPEIYLELIPVKKIKKPTEAKNSTDLSYAHVKYINKKTKSSKLLDEIRIAKAFVHANKCYGAESYIGGFSGYSLELLTIYYKSFLNFVKAISKIKEKEIIDIEKQYKNKKEIMIDINSSKLKSPIILIDPTYKQRNALAALKKETFEKFQNKCISFLKNPNIKFFKEEEIKIEKIKKQSKKSKEEFILIEAVTNKQEGEIAASKLKKFYEHLEKEISKFYEIKEKGFIYESGKNASFFYSVKKKKEIIFNGPQINDKKNLEKFKKKHKKTFIKKGKIYAKEKITESLKDFLQGWKVNHKKRILEMSVKDFKII